MTDLSSYLDYLEGCRFCPMCKPANEIQNVLYLESVSTRARALMIWSRLNSGLEYDGREIEILFQSTLDSISEAWCRSRYNVSGYIQAARADLVSQEKVPVHIREWVDRSVPEIEPPETSTVFLLGEAGYLDTEDISEKASQFIRDRNKSVSVIRYPNAGVEYALGFVERAREMLTAIHKSLAGVDTVVVDGPSTWYALEKLGPKLGVSGTNKPVIKTLVDIITDAKATLKAELLPKPTAKVFYHDGRYSFPLAEGHVDARAIAPEFDLHNEEWLGRGRVFEAPRELIRQTGLDIQKSFWTRNLSRSSGADDGLFITYPDYASLLGQKLLEYAAEQGAEAVLTASILDAVHLRGLEREFMPVFWLPELFMD